MSDELKQLIEDAAKLLGLNNYRDTKGWREEFNPLDPERGDLMKVAEAAELWIDFQFERVFYDCSCDEESFGFYKCDHQSLALAILRAASAVLHSRGGV